MNNKALREEFNNFCNTDNFSAPPYETDTITNWWLSHRQKEWEEILGKIENMPIEEVGNSAKTLDQVISLIKANLEV